MEMPHIVGAGSGRLGKKPVQLKGQRIRSNGASTGKTVHAHSLVALAAGRSLSHHHGLHLESWEPRLGAGQILHMPFDAPRCVVDSACSRAEHALLLRDVAFAGSHRI